MCGSNNFYFNHREILVEESNVQRVDSPVTVSACCCSVMKGNNGLLKVYHNLHVLIDYNTLSPTSCVCGKLLILTLLLCGFVEFLVNLVLNH